MKDYSAKLYKSKQWQHTRQAYLASVGGLCERCYAKGLIVPAEIVHHKIHVSPDNINDSSITLNWSNLMAVCRECHAELHEKEKRYKVDEFGNVIINE